VGIIICWGLVFSFFIGFVCWELIGGDRFRDE